MSNINHHLIGDLILYQVSDVKSTQVVPEERIICKQWYLFPTTSLDSKYLKEKKKKSIKHRQSYEGCNTIKKNTLNKFSHYSQI